MKKQLSKGWLLLLMAVLIIGALVSCSKEVKTDLSPSEHVIEAVNKTFESGNYDLSANMTIDLDYEKMSANMDTDGLTKEMTDLINNFSIDLNYKLKHSLQAKVFEYFVDYNINYKENPLMSLEMILNKDVVGFGLTNFYDKFFVVDFTTLFDELMSQEALMTVKDFDLEKYMAIVLETEPDLVEKIKANKNYEKVLLDHLNTHLSDGVAEEIAFTEGTKSVKEQVLTYEYDFTLEGYMSLLESIIDEAKTDEDLKTYVKAIVNNVLDEMIESKDYEMFDLSEDDLLRVQILVDSDFDTTWDELFIEYEGAYSGFDDMMLYMSEDDLEMINAFYDNLDLSVSIDKDDMIRTMAVALDYNGVGFNVDYTINAIGEDVVIETTPEQYVDFMQFIDIENPTEIQQPEVFATLIKDIMVDGLNELIDGPAYVDLFKDLAPFEDELGVDPSMFKTYLEMARVFVNNLKTEDIVEAIESSLTPYSYEDDYTDYDDYDDYTPVTLDMIAFITSEDPEQSIEASNIKEGVEVNSYLSEIPSVSFVSTEATREADFQNALDSGADIIFVKGEVLADMIIEYATLYPEVYFVYFDGELDYYETNLVSVEYYNEESAYVAGYIAGLSTESGKVGFLGGLEDSATLNYEIAYRDGALAANEVVEVSVKYAGSIDNDDLGKEMGQIFSDEGIDVIYHAAGLTGNGMMDASVELGYKVIGDESGYGSELETYLTSTLRDYNYMTGQMIADHIDFYMSSYYSYGIYDDALYLPQGNLSDEINNARLVIVDQISSGDLFIPQN